MSKHGIPVHKPRRAFKAWLIHTLAQQGARLSADPSYVEIQLVLLTRGLTPSGGSPRTVDLDSPGATRRVRADRPERRRP